MAILRNTLGQAGLGLALLLVSCGCEVPLVTATTTLQEQFETGPAPKIVVETFNGPIDISEGESNEVVVEVTKRASGIDREAAEANLDYVEVSMVQNDDTIRVTVQRVGRRIGNCGAAVVIAAPKMAKLHLQSSNGHIICEGLQGGIDAKTSNAKLEIAEGRGAIDVTTSNGAIDIEATDAVVDARSSNARIRFEGSLANKEHQFKSSNGRIDLYLPANSQFRFDGSTSNARVQCAFPVATKDRARRGKLHGSVGENPSCSIIAATSNAGINIREADSEAD